MLYEDIQFSKVKNRPFFYTNFVSTIDGKVMVKSSPRGYWPIGSAIDNEILEELRAKADLLIHGKTTSMWYRTLNKINRPEFLKKRKSLGKNGKLPYMVISSNPDDSLIDYLEKSDGNIPFLATTKNAQVSKSLQEIIQVVRFGDTAVDLHKLSEFLFEKGFKNVLLEGGPTVLGSFFAQNLIDEVFLTIAPKIFGNKDDNTMTMVEGFLLPHIKIKRCILLSVRQIDNEIFLRYKVGGI